jgi:predicted RND superfamily exporter protein
MDMVRAERTLSWLEAHSMGALAGVLAITAVFLAPALFLAPDQEASTDPSHEVFDTLDTIDERLVSPIFDTFWIVESLDGDMLRRDPLLELLENEAALRNEPEVAAKLIRFESAKYGDTYFGVYTIADGVDKWLRDNGYGGLETANDDLVKLAADELLSGIGTTDELGDNFSTQTTVERRVVEGQEIDYRVVPAFAFPVLADNEALGGGGFTAGLGGDDTIIDKEEYSRDVRELLEGEEALVRVYGVAIDANLTSQEEGATAGPFITFTIIAVLIVVGVVLRSYWAVAVSGAALAILMVWLKGVTNLVGLENSLIMSFIVPIAMISFGIDFAFHAIGRYREAAEDTSNSQRRAFVAGLTAVSGALLLALASDSLAFLSNVTAGIPAVVEFGIGATIALICAYLVLGIMTPLALMRIEERVPAAGAASRAGSVGRWLLIGLTATVAGFVVLFLIFFPVIGAVALVVYLVAFLAFPLWLATRRGESPGAVPATTHGGTWPWMGRVVGSVAGMRYAVLPAVAVITALAAWQATGVQAAFDVEDFFSSGNEFVVGLDVVDEHISSGEPAIVYIEGDLANPAVLAELEGFVGELDDSPSGRFGRLADGEIQVDRGALLIVRDAMGSPTAVTAITAATGVDLVDANGDLIPDTREGVLAIYQYALQGGIPGENGQVLAPTDIPARIWISEDGTEMATKLIVGLTGTREQSNVTKARDELEPLIAALESDIEAVSGSAYVSLTGSPIARDEGLSATVNALLTSLPIAVVLCLVVAALFMRSIRYGVVSTIPILLVVAWLYAFMALADFNLNIATATIGAISIGVGIDYAIHFTMRFREELERTGVRTTALELAGAGTGSALVASAASSVVGFAIMAFAPMPMFATYGLLTAVMIIFSAAAALLVLPSLLMLVSRDREAEAATIPGGAALVAE